MKLEDFDGKDERLIDMMKAVGTSIYEFYRALAQLAAIVASMPKNLKVIAEKLAKIEDCSRKFRNQDCKRGWGYQSKLNRPNPKPKPKPYWLRIRSRLW